MKSDGWIPPASTDVVQAVIELMACDPRSDDYLRPSSNSPLASAGLEDPRLPRYVGAVPPQGVERWQWSFPSRFTAADEEPSEQ